MVGTLNGGTGRCSDFQGQQVKAERCFDHQRDQVNMDSRVPSGSAQRITRDLKWLTQTVGASEQHIATRERRPLFQPFPAQSKADPAECRRSTRASASTIALSLFRLERRRTRQAWEAAGKRPGPPLSHQRSYPNFHFNLTMSYQPLNPHYAIALIAKA